MVSIGSSPSVRLGLRNRLSVQASIPAAARVRRALRATASSIIWPSTVPTPLAFSARMARAFSTASALGVSAALIARDLCGMDRGLGGEAERHGGGDLLLQAGLVMQIEERRVDRR